MIGGNPPKDPPPGLPAQAGTGVETSAGNSAQGTGAQESDEQAQPRARSRDADTEESSDETSLLPSITLPKGGGAIRGIGEKFSVNAATGAASLSVPIGTSPGRGGFGPSLSLNYNAGGGNSPFGLGWQLSPPSISRRTEKGLPRYLDAENSDVFVLVGAEDLVPVIDETTQQIVEETITTAEGDFRVRRYRPRVEAGFSRIERWTHSVTKDVHWQVTGGDNLTRIFGKSENSRIADPRHPQRIFSWLLEETRDDRGNITRFEYKEEDGKGVDPAHPAERARFEAQPNGTLLFSATAQRYLKRIHYGNRQPGIPTDYMFQLVLDYGEHDPDIPTPTDDDNNDWPVRQDPFSTHRAGFDVRTYRLCRRFLMFHQFPELGPEPQLVWSTDLLHSESPVLTKLASVVQHGYQRNPDGSYTSESPPPLALGYTEPELHTELEFLPEDSLAGITGGVTSGKAQWVDLNGEGIPGVVLSTAEGLYYKTNRGGAQLSPPQQLAEMPAGAELVSGRQQLTDIDADNRLELVEFTPERVGAYPRTDDGKWTTFYSLPAAPNLDWNDPNLRFVDLDGDGFADLLITEHDCFVWYRSLGRDGFAAPQRLSKPNNEDNGPTIVFVSSTETIQLLDMSGDGLVDIVRARNGEVCYWPNLGYGRFGKKITLANSPTFAQPDAFDPQRVRFADVDGSGTQDVLYVGSDGVNLWFNEAGNGLSEKHHITSLPALDIASTVSFVDLLGNGTATLVWSSPWREGSQPVGYVDLMGGVKPHVLNRVVNNLGSETRIAHKSSVHFYLEDQAAGRPWLTRLPFPVQVVERVEHLDHVGGTRLIQRYAYHHGFFDGVEQEFRGFAMVEQFDAEAIGGQQGIGLFPGASEPERSIPPIHTKTWFHTGAFLERERLEQALAEEYFQGDPDAPLLPDTILPTGLTPREQREAVRALRGQLLRQEVYADDGTDQAAIPYVVTEANFEVRREQRAVHGRNGVFFSHPRSSLSLNYERNPADPRTTQQLVIQVDAFGNVEESASIGYPRRSIPAPDPGNDVPDLVTEQSRLWATYTVASFANNNTRESYRHSVAYERQTWELSGLATPDPKQPFTIDQVRDAFHSQTTEIAFETPVNLAVLQKRLVEHSQQYFYIDDDTDPNYLSGSLPFGEIGNRALNRDTRTLAFTPGMLAAGGALEGRTTPALLTDEGKYLEQNGAYWAQSGRLLYDPTRFFRPTQALDPFGNLFTLELDAHTLLVTRTEDPLGNVVQAENDYRTLSPVLVTDPNGNRVAVAFDALQRVERTAVMGKAHETLGDTLEDPTQRFEYFIDSFQADGTPVHVRTFAREQHGAANPRFQETVLYTDGFGREVMTKVQAEPGDAPLRNPDGTLQTNPDGSLVVGFVPERWVGTGRTIFDNKGNPIKQYEPFFSSTDGYETEDELVEFGVTPILHYDPLGRLIRTQNPDGSEARVEFDNWFQRTFDPNDAVRNPDGSPTEWLAARQGGAAAPQDQRAAQLTLEHENTPTVTHFDSLGRPFLVVADNAAAGKYETRSTFDIEGNVLRIIDANGITTVSQDYDVLGRRLRITTADAGTRWTLQDIVGKPIRAWDSREHTFRTVYDSLQRPTELYVTAGAATEQLVQKTVYGELHPDVTDRNLRQQVYQIYDGAGVATSLQYDFKGNLVDSERRLTTVFQTTVDWTALSGLTDIAAIEAAAAPLLETTSYTSHTEFDALNRITLQRSPDLSTTRPEYNEANLLEAIHVSVKGTPEQPVVTNLDYNARGQRVLVEYANGTKTAFSYDPLTFRLTNLLTTNTAGTVKFQDLSYTYDPVGNIVDQRDRADFSPIFTQQPIQADGQYRYDAIYRLIEASGREHPGQQAVAADPPRGAVPHVNDAIGRLIAYTENYSYDPVGNIQQIIHNANGAGWTRSYEYAADSNRLLRTSLPGESQLNAIYGYADTAANNAGLHGSMTSMPHLNNIEWDYADRMQHADLLGGGDVYFTYDSSGQRVRKVHVHGGRVDERIYLGAFEIYREHTGGALTGPVQLERETLHLFDDQRRVGIVETKTVDITGGPGVLNQSEWRFQLDNHLGSSAIELDATAGVISYEEYHPFGSTAFHTARGALGVSAKRYRYTGKEKDEETGLYYHGARYYAPWLGRWTAVDPSTFKGSHSRYDYVNDNPIRFKDSTGNEPEEGGVSTGFLLGLAAAVVVGTVVTVATAGLAGPIVGAAAATVIGGAAGGAVGGVAGSAVEDLVDTGDVDIGKAAISGAIGGATGGLLAGAGVGVGAALRTQGGRRLASSFSTSGVGQAFGRGVQGIRRSAIGRASQRVGSLLRENVAEPAERAGVSLGRELGGSAAERAAEFERRAATRAAVRAEVATQPRRGDPAKANLRGEVDGKSINTSVASGGDSKPIRVLNDLNEQIGQRPRPSSQSPIVPLQAVGRPKGQTGEPDAEFALVTDLITEAGGVGSTAPTEVFLGANRLVCNSCRSAVAQTRAFLPNSQIEIVEDTLSLQLGGAFSPFLQSTDRQSSPPPEAADPLGPGAVGAPLQLRFSF